MSSIPLPALHVNPPQQQDPMASVEKLVQLKSLMQGQQLQQGQIQEQQQQITDNHALTTAMKNWDPKTQSYDDLTHSVLKNGGSGNAALAIKQHALTVQKTVSDIAAQDAATGSKNLETFIGSHKAIGSALEGIESVPDDQLHDKAISTVNELVQSKILQPEMAQKFLQGIQQTSDPKVLRQSIDTFAKSSAGALAVAEEKKTEAQTAESNAKAAESNTQSQVGQQKLETIRNYKNNPQLLNSEVDAAAPPNKYGSLNVRTKALVNQAMSVGDVDAAKKAIEDASQQVSGIEKEINPQVQQNKVAVATAEGQARANIEAKTARGSNAALAEVPPHLVAPASAAANKAGEDYAQAQSVTQRLQAMMDAARRGNVVSYQLIPQEGALQVTTSQGVHRINMAEIQNYGGGSLWQKLQGHIGKALTGASIPSSVLDDMSEMQKIQQEGSQSKYNNSIKTINETYGSKFKPVEMEAKPNAPSGPPSGATMKVPGSDGKLHWSDGKRDLGVAQ
jgi:hypothetical protein